MTPAQILHCILQVCDTVSQPASGKCVAASRIAVDHYMDRISDLLSWIAFWLRFTLKSSSFGFSTEHVSNLFHLATEVSHAPRDNANNSVSMDDSQCCGIQAGVRTGTGLAASAGLWARSIHGS